ncbi:MAG: M28 family peptidase [Flavitalea sp.]
MATKGDTLAAQYVGIWFKMNGLKEPYRNGNSFMQGIEAKRIINTSNLEFGGIQYPLYDGWSLYPHITNSIIKLPVLCFGAMPFDSILKTQGDYLRGNAILVDGMVMLTAIRTGMIDSVEAILTNRGVKAVIFADSVVHRIVAQMKERLFLPRYQVDLPGETPNGGMPEISITPEMLKKFVLPDNLPVNASGRFTDTTQRFAVKLKSTVSVNISETVQTVIAPNVIGVIPGSDTTLDVVVVGAHRDHDGKNGSDIYHGAVDNASGTVAIMQIASMMNEAVKKGFRPKRTIVFNSYTGEERGLLGSGWYVNHPLHAMNKTHAMLNLDMLGRVDTSYSGKKADSNYVYYQVSDSLNRGLSKAIQKASATMPGLKLDPHFQEPPYRRRMLTGSDHYNFYLKGVPVIAFTCGFPPEYHKPDDTADKINYELLKQQTQLAFLTLWNLAND